MVQQLNYINRHVSKKELIISNLFADCIIQTNGKSTTTKFGKGTVEENKKKLASEERIERESLCLQIKSSKYEGDRLLTP